MLVCDAMCVVVVYIKLMMKADVFVRFPIVILLRHESLISLVVYSMEEEVVATTRRKKALI